MYHLPILVSIQKLRLNLSEFPSFIPNRTVHNLKVVVL